MNSSSDIIIKIPRYFIELDRIKTLNKIYIFIIILSYIVFIATLLLIYYF